jgi:soluble lytic murein transglycosylase-like protein
MFEKVDPPEIKKISEALVDECQKTGVDHLFVLAVIEAESSFDVEAVSSTGARGLMQLMPGTFREVSNAKRMFDPAENVRAGTRYIAKLYSQGFKRMDTVLLAYNQGAGGAIAVAKGEMEMPAEADVYIPKVIKRYRELLAKVGKNPKDAKKLFLVATR